MIRFKFATVAALAALVAISAESAFAQDYGGDVEKAHVAAQRALQKGGRLGDSVIGSAALARGPPKGRRN